MDLIIAIVITFPVLLGLLWLAAYAVRSGWNAAAPKPPPSPEEQARRELERRQFRIWLLVVGSIVLAFTIAMFALQQH